MGKLCTKQILRLLWKMVENKFFLDSEHEGVTGELLFPLRGGKQVQVRGIPPLRPQKNQRTSLETLLPTLLFKYELKDIYNAKKCHWKMLQTSLLSEQQMLTLPTQKSTIELDEWGLV